MTSTTSSNAAAATMTGSSSSSPNVALVSARGAASGPKDPRNWHSTLSAQAFPAAAQPDIIRANQKDAYYQSILQEKFTEVYRSFFGTRNQLRNQKYLNLITDFCYFCLTTLPGGQTLGEEYCGILQVDVNRKRPPGYKKRAALVVAHVLFLHILTQLKAQLQRRSFMPECDKQASPSDTENRATLVRRRARRVASGLCSFFEQHGRSIHVALFYFYGTYYHFSKRATGFRYILMRQLQPGEQRQGYEVLGALIFFQLAIRLIILLREGTKTRTKEINAESEVIVAERPEDELSGRRSPLPERFNDVKCALCLGPRMVTTATLCGHLFCWTCICEWCRSKPECPLCRQPTRLPHLLPLYHYD